MSKSASFAKHHMRENRNNQFRPEQQQMCSELRKCGDFSEWSIVMEIPIHYVDEQENNRTCIGDIVMEEIGVIYRLNGEIHNSNRSEEKDYEQKLYLEALGYLVIDVDTT